MGVRGLLTYLRSCHVIRHANMNVSGWRIGLDGFSLIFLYKEERQALREYLEAMKTRGSLTLVMDRRAAKEKKEVVDKRKDARKEAKADAASLVSTIAGSDLDEDQLKILEKALAAKEKQAWCLYPDYVKWFVKLLEELEIQLIWAEEEADEVLAIGDYDAVVSSDSDLLILGAYHEKGCRRLWLPRAIAVQHNEINMESFKSIIGLQQEQLYQLSFLAGCDVQPKSMMPVNEAVSRLRFYGSIRELYKRHPEIVSKEDIDRYEILRKNVWKK